MNTGFGLLGFLQIKMDHSRLMTYKYCKFLTLDITSNILKMQTDSKNQDRGGILPFQISRHKPIPEIYFSVHIRKFDILILSLFSTTEFLAL